MFNIGDTVRVYNSKGQDSGIVSKILKIIQSSINGETVYGLENGYQYPERWLRLEKENNMFEVGDLVKYTSGESVYEVKSIENDSCKLCHLKSGKVYNEGVPTSRLVKLKFKIGDKVRVLQGKYKDNISTIIGAHITNTLYYDVKDSPIGFTENSLELVSEESSKFKKGDLVYIKIGSSQCYKVLQVIETKNGNVICTDQELKKHSFDEKSLTKFKFQPNDTAQVTNLYSIDYKRIFIVNDIRFSLNHKIEYSSVNSNIWYEESELDLVREDTDAKIAVTINDDMPLKVTTINDDKSVQVADGEIKISKCIIDDLEERVSELIDTYINNNNLNQNQNENRLQREEAPVRGDHSKRTGVYGRRYQTSIGECYQRYEAGFSKSKKHSIRVKDQLSTSYSRAYGSKD